MRISLQYILLSLVILVFTSVSLTHYTTHSLNAASIAQSDSTPQVVAAAIDEPNIVGGEVADPAAWPWMVALVVANQPASTGQFCGGSLIHPQYVLTAAHCTYGEGAIQPSQVEVIVGDYRLSDAAGQRLAVTQIIRHPDYNPAGSDYDVALLRLATTASPANPVDVAGILPGALEEPNASAVVIGWGLTQPGSNNSASDLLRQVTVPLVSNQTCLQSYGLFDGTVTDNMLCAGLFQGGKDSCQGDSGGPLMVYDSVAKRWKQVGVVSWGDGCAQRYFYGIYARLSRFAGWISQQIPALATPTPTITATPTPAATPSPSATATRPLTPTLTATATFIPTNIAATFPAVTPTLASPTTTPTRTTTPTPGPVYLPVIARGFNSTLSSSGFEEGTGNAWQEFSLLGRSHVIERSTSAHSGEWLVQLGLVDKEVAYVAQRLQIPSDRLWLTFWYQIASNESFCGYDFGGVAINGVEIAGVLDLCRATRTSVWKQCSISLANFANREVELQIRAENDAQLISTLRVDDVTLTPASAGACPNVNANGAALASGDSPYLWVHQERTHGE